MQVGNRYRIVNVTSEDTNETRETESKSVEDSDDQKVPAASSTDYARPYGFVVIFGNLIIFIYVNKDLIFHIS